MMKERMLKVIQYIKDWCVAHKVFVGIMILEALVVLYLGAMLFVPKTVVEFPLEYFAQANASSAVCMGEEGLVIQNEPSVTTEISLFSEAFSMPRGAYTLTAHYQSTYQIAQPSHSLEEETVALILQIPTSKESFVQTETLLLKDSARLAQGRTWVSYGADIQQAQLLIYYNGIGRAQISSIVLEEQLAYRWITLLGVCAVFFVCNAVAYLLTAPTSVKGQQRAQSIKTFVVLFGIALFASLPFLADFLFNGHDMMTQIVRIHGIAAEMVNGQFPVRMQTELLNGYGYAESLFYCDLFLYLPALLYLCMVPMQMVYQIYVVSVNFATVAIAYVCFGKMSKSRTIGMVGAVAYTLASYRLTDVYNRAAMGEYTAMTFYPLVALGLYEIYRKEKPIYRDWFPLALGVAGVIQSHVLSTEMLMIALGIFCLLVVRKTLSWARIKVLASAAALCAGISAWFWVPFLETFKTVDIDVKHTAEVSAQANGIYPAQLFSIWGFLTGKGEQWDSRGMSLALGWVLCFAGLLACYYITQHKALRLAHSDAYGSMKVALALGTVISLFTLKIFPWDFIAAIHPLAAMVVNIGSFPWRYLSVATACLTVVLVLVLVLVKEKHRIYYKTLAVGIVIFSLVSTSVFYSEFMSTDTIRTLYTISAQQTFSIGWQEYKIDGSDVGEANVTAVGTSSDEIEEISYERVNGISYVTYTNNSESEQTLLLPIFNYPNYRATNTQTGDILPIANGENNRISLAVAAGTSGTIKVAYVAPWYWHVAEAISVLSWAFVAFMAVATRCKKRTTETVQREEVCRETADAT